MKGKAWTKEETTYLKRWWGKKSRTQIAKHLGKSVEAIKGKVTTMGLGTYLDNSEKIHISEVSRMVGVDKTTIYKSWLKKGLKFQKTPLYLMVWETDLLEFMQKHTDLWDARKCDYYMFYSFPWFQEKLKADRNSSSYKYKNWTEYEITQLEFMKKRGMSNQEIATALNRTLRSVAGKWNYLNNKF